ncbi:glycosyltransferase family 32 protein, partial [Rosenbergiella epipactidis]|uniref:glycosyltransferase family 32 protein n=1 Tax=Rosenbergiella epipactidis TaxID=1544694 RepID=UPI001F4E7A33
EINQDSKKSDYVYPKKIWLYWDDDKYIPDIVKISIYRLKKFCADFEVVLLNSKTVCKYVNLTNFNASLPPAIKADFIRLSLLNDYGGVWMDASIILNENLDWIFSKINGQDAFVFFSDECTSDIKRPITENWFIISPLGSRFISDWLDEFKKCVFSSNPISYYNSIKFDKSLVQQLTRVDYLLCYISAIVVTNNSHYNILYSSSASSGHYFNYLHHFSGDYVAAELTLKNKSNLPFVKMVKLTSGSRTSVQKNIEKNLILGESYIGDIIKDYESSEK